MEESVHINYDTMEIIIKIVLYYNREMKNEEDRKTDGQRERERCF